MEAIDVCFDDFNGWIGPISSSSTEGLKWLHQCMVTILPKHLISDELTYARAVQ